jgi:hypothetical protein
MLYKISVAYEDYNKTKVETKLKRDILEQVIYIIEKDCNTIDLVKPKMDGDERLKDGKSVGLKEEKRIIAYPNERAVMYALYTYTDVCIY